MSVRGRLLQRVQPTAAGVAVAVARRVVKEVPDAVTNLVPRALPAVFVPGHALLDDDGVHQRACRAPRVVRPFRAPLVPWGGVLAAAGSDGASASFGPEP